MVYRVKKVGDVSVKTAERGEVEDNETQENGKGKKWEGKVSNWRRNRRRVKRDTKTRKRERRSEER